MKFRNGFVTNSSSSSYIIAYKSLPELDEETIKKYPFLKNYSILIDKVLFAEGDNDTSEGKKISSKEEWNEYFIDRYGWSEKNTIDKILEDDEFLVDTYNKAVEYLAKGFNILDKSIDYNDTYCSNIIKELTQDEENFIILEGE